MLRQILKTADAIVHGEPIMTVRALPVQYPDGRCLSLCRYRCDGIPAVFSCIDRLNQLRAKCLFQSLSDTGLHFRQIPILLYIREHPYCPQEELAKAFSLTPGSIALSTKRLEKAGFLVKETDEDNKRRNKLSLTSQSIEILDRACQSSLFIHERALAGCSAQELDLVCRILEALCKNFTDELDHQEVSR